MKLLLIQNHPVEGPGLIADCLHRRGVMAEVARAGSAGSLPGPAGFAAVVVFGSPASCTELHRHPELGAVRALLVECLGRGAPVLGICFGGQLLADVLGAAVRRNEASEIGAYPVDLTDAGKASPLLGGFPASFMVAQWHRDTFEVPPGAELLATAALCRNQAFAWRDSLGLQFHPELTPAQADAWVDAYAADVPLVGKSASRVRAELRDCAAESAMRCDRLVENFLTRSCGWKSGR